MIDSAGIRMAQGAPIACERISGMNDNMRHSHYHDYYELYYLEGGERFLLIDGKVHHITSDQYVLFPPFSMHHSYGKNDAPFRRIVLYFKADQIRYPLPASRLPRKANVFITDHKNTMNVHRCLCELLKEETAGSPFLYEAHDPLRQDYMNALLNTLILTILPREGQETRLAKQDHIGDIVKYIHTNYSQRHK